MSWLAVFGAGPHGGRPRSGFSSSSSVVTIRGHMNAPTLILISVDAMEDVDEEYARTLPFFRRILDNPARAQIQAVYPTLTYPNHTAQITGCPPAVTGIFNNVRMQPGVGHPDWFWWYRFIQVPTLLDQASAAGMKVATVEWPVTAGAPFDVVVPEIGNEGRTGGVEKTMRAACSPRGYELFERHRHRIVEQPKRNHGAFAASVAADVLREDCPDLLLIHLVELDASRHRYGPRGPHIREALRVIDSRLGTVLGALEETGEVARSNIVIVSDHGQLDVVQHTNLNSLLAQRGFLELDAAGHLASWDAYLHSSGLSGQLFVSESIPALRRRKLEDLLVEIVEDPKYRIRKVWTAREARDAFGLDGPFSYVIESDPGVIVGGALDRRVVVRRTDSDFSGNLGNHGHHPGSGAQPVFLATGPAFIPGADAGRHQMTDEAPTLAHAMGLQLPEARGSSMSALLRPGP
ncbi:alkaline phosphatase family protein [Acidipropionibacterium jensenii]|nr:alkaline phosphatase family protein [Acidipropionibacterium jensenii]